MREEGVALALLALPSKRGVVFFAAREQILPFPRFDAMVYASKMAPIRTEPSTVLLPGPVSSYESNRMGMKAG